MLPLRARVNLGAMAMKECSAFPKAPALLEPHHQIGKCHIQNTHGGKSYSSSEKQSVYCKAPANWAKGRVGFLTFPSVVYKFFKYSFSCYGNIQKPDCGFD